VEPENIRLTMKHCASG